MVGVGDELGVVLFGADSSVVEVGSFLGGFFDFLDEFV